MTLTNYRPVTTAQLEARAYSQGFAAGQESRRALVKELAGALQATLGHIPVSAAIALAPRVDAVLAKARQQA